MVIRKCFPIVIILIWGTGLSCFPSHGTQPVKLKLGLIESDGKTVMPAQFARLYPTGTGFYIAYRPVKEDGLCTLGVRPEPILVNRSGEIVAKLSPVINSIDLNKAAITYLAISEGNKCMIGALDGKVVAGPFDDCLAISNDLCIVRSGSSCQLVIPGKSKKRLDDCLGAKSGNSSRGVAIKTKSGWGFVDRSAAMAVQPNNEDIRSERDGFIQILPKSGDTVSSWQTLDLDAKAKEQFRFYRVGEGSSGFIPAAVKTKGTVRWGVIDSKRNWQIQPKYNLVEICQNGQAIVSNPDGSCQLIDPVSKKTSIKFKRLSFLGGEWFAFKSWDQKTDDVGLIHSNGTVAKTPMFRSLLYCGQNLFAFENADHVGKFGLMDQQGTIIKAPFLDYISAAPLLKNGGQLIPANINERNEKKWGWINARGQWIVKPKFDFAGPFVGGLAAFGLRTTD